MTPHGGRPSSRTGHGGQSSGRTGRRTEKVGPLPGAPARTGGSRGRVHPGDGQHPGTVAQPRRALAQSAVPGRLAHASAPLGKADGRTPATVRLRRSGRTAGLRGGRARTDHQTAGPPDLPHGVARAGPGASHGWIRAAAGADESRGGADIRRVLIRSDRVSGTSPTAQSAAWSSGRPQARRSGRPMRDHRRARQGPLAAEGPALSGVTAVWVNSAFPFPRVWADSCAVPDISVELRDLREAVDGPNQSI